MKEQEITALKAQYPDRELVSLSSPSARDVIAKLPSMVEMAELRNRLNDSVKKGGAMEWFVRSCVVHPPRDVLNEILTRKPVLIEKWYQKLEAEAGGAEEVEISKL